jgi:hypothetical protein
VDVDEMQVAAGAGVDGVKDGLEQVRHGRYTRRLPAEGVVASVGSSAQCRPGWTYLTAASGAQGSAPWGAFVWVRYPRSQGTGWRKRG